MVDMAPALMMNQLCKVCGEPAAGYHFGAFTCEGCKSFFGRTYNNLSALGECKNNGQCVINKKNRTSCKSCRLKKCILVGMSKSGSRYGRRSNWFKIHCLIQDQTELNGRIADQAALSDGQSHYKNKDLVSSIKSEDSSSKTSPNGMNHVCDVKHLMKSSLPFSVYDTKLLPGNFGHLEPSNNSYERKENISYHSLPLSPISPMSPVNPNNFLFHQSNGTLFTKGYNRSTKLYSPDINYNYCQRYLDVNKIDPVLKTSQDGVPVAMDYVADTPEQETPIDLSVKKYPPLVMTSHDLYLTNKRSPPHPTGNSPLANISETPLDLTRKM
ncbi:uncharacterized protein LOC143255987 isoform X1 [Tachypleus tridentatus]|uniref:uncharacterized protein LOC143255987 isoform X1 n=2 Tax=Tachypleus tridentatus TaxID=6853 RepID=UPI003FD0FE3C